MQASTTKKKKKKFDEKKVEGYIYCLVAIDKREKYCVIVLDAFGE